ncbi:MAG: SDR family oxidoreductase [Alphaproteobacteria bacterium]|nr:SDR family oxidoreductase [Alphaproteobacteria bacterium]
MTAGHLFCFGLGYTAAALAERLRTKGWRISGTRRASDQERTDCQRFDRDHPLGDLDAALAGVSHILSSVPPDAAGDPVLDLCAADLGRRQDLQWVGYLSTTGVYGDRAGGWVDEESRLEPVSERGRRRVEAEAGWRRLWRDHGLPVHVFRLAAIYGPGRNMLETVRSGRAQRVTKPGQLFSRVHVADICAVLEASMARPRAGGIYNVCDDLAAPPEDVVAHASALLGVRPPPAIPLEAADLTAMARSFYGESKRVRNDLIKQELGVMLAYPTYRDGLSALNSRLLDPL